LKTEIVFAAERLSDLH